MTGTTRTSYDGAPLLDGEHGKKCGIKNCWTGVHGAPKVHARRVLRRGKRRDIRESQA